MPLSSNSLDFIRTQSDREALLSDLLLLENALFESKQGENFQEILFSTVSEKTSKLISSILKTVTDYDVSAIRGVVVSVKRDLVDLKVVSFTLAFDPTQETVLLLSRWARDVFLKTVLVETLLDKSILGGVIVVYGGIYKDFSVKRILETKFDKERDEILKLLQ